MISNNCNNFSVHGGTCIHVPRKNWRYTSRMIPFQHRTTESNTLQGYVTLVMDCERGYVELSLYIWNAVLTYIQLLEDIVNYLTIKSNI